MLGPLSTPTPDPSDTVRLRTVLLAWAPLAASWVLMGLELPIISMALARLRDPTVSLAAYGGVVMPISMVIESPIIMLLAASTALSRNLASYRLVHRFMLILGGILTLLHALVAFTPLYDWLAGHVLGAPREVLEPARLGLRIMTPWTLAIAYRRFQQGVLIRFGRSHAVGIGTAVRLATIAVVLAIGWHQPGLSGIAIGTCAVALGVAAEAIYAGWQVRPVLRHQLPAVSADPPLTGARFLRFYLPLLITPLFSFLTIPLASAAMSRMPRPIESLAIWSVVNGVLLPLRTLGFALNEVVVAMLDRPNAVPALRRFAFWLAAGTSGLLLLFAVTPLASLWFRRLAALDTDLARLAGTALLSALLVPGLSPLVSLYQGAIVHSHRTRGVTESVVIGLVVTGLGLLAGAGWGGLPGVHVALIAMTLGILAQLAWLRYRALEFLREMESSHYGSADEERVILAAP